MNLIRLDWGKADSPVKTYQVSELIAVQVAALESVHVSHAFVTVEG